MQYSASDPRRSAKPAPLAFIDDVIGQIPVVGRFWADALHVWVGVTQAMSMTALRDESLAGAPPFVSGSAPEHVTDEPLRRAA
jgi:hypothetical protein